MKNKFSPAGLFLWKVHVDNWNESLWITTTHRSMPIAAAKAQRIAKRYALENGKKFTSIGSISCEGYIDA